MSENPRGEVLCPRCFRPWEACVCEQVSGVEDWAQEEATCPECSKPWEDCGCGMRPASHSLPAPELDL